MSKGNPALATLRNKMKTYALTVTWSNHESIDYAVEAWSALNAIRILSDRLSKAAAGNVVSIALANF